MTSKTTTRGAIHSVALAAAVLLCALATPQSAQAQGLVDFLWGGGNDYGGGRHVAARPYSKSALNKDFRTIRELAFGKEETRQLQDMRRSGAVEGDAGGGGIEDQSNKMANTVDRNKRLRQTYNPVNVVSVRRFDEARAIGAAKLEQRASESVTTPPLVTLLKSGIAAKPLK